MMSHGVSQKRETKQRCYWSVLFESCLINWSGLVVCRDDRPNSLTNPIVCFDPSANILQLQIWELHRNLLTLLFNLFIFEERGVQLWYRGPKVCCLPESETQRAVATTLAWRYFPTPNNDQHRSTPISWNRRIFAAAIAHNVQDASGVQTSSHAVACCRARPWVEPLGFGSLGSQVEEMQKACYVKICKHM